MLYDCIGEFAVPHLTWKSAAPIASQALKSKMEYLLCEVFSNYPNRQPDGARWMTNNDKKPEDYSIVKILFWEEDPIRLTP